MFLLPLLLYFCFVFFLHFFCIFLLFDLFFFFFLVVFLVYIFFTFFEEKNIPLFFRIWLEAVNIRLSQVPACRLFFPIFILDYAASEPSSELRFQQVSIHCTVFAI